MCEVQFWRDCSSADFLSVLCSFLWNIEDSWDTDLWAQYKRFYPSSRKGSKLSWYICIVNITGLDVYAKEKCWLYCCVSNIHTPTTCGVNIYDKHGDITDKLFHITAQCLTKKIMLWDVYNLLFWQNLWILMSSVFWPCGLQFSISVNQRKSCLMAPHWKTASLSHQWQH